MSRIGKKPITVLEKVKVSLDNESLIINGPQGTLHLKVPNSIKVDINNDQIILSKLNEDKKTKQLYGLYRTLINNMVLGTNISFSKHLIIHGVGYRAQINKQNLILNVGYSHPVIITPPTNTKIELQSNTHIVVIGLDKAIVGQVASKIRSVRPPEPYKGKGIRYQQEILKQKIGKTGK